MMICIVWTMLCARWFICSHQWCYQVLSISSSWEVSFKEEDEGGGSDVREGAREGCIDA